MKTILFLFLLITIATADAQMVKNNQIVIGKTDSVNSKILGEKRKVWVYLPNGYDNNAYSKQTYPVIYLLDGDGHFSSVTGMIQQLSEVNGNTVVPQMIVVAILNTDRTRDLTPTKALTGPDGSNADFLRSSGGGEKFTAFMEKELMPHIDSTYHTAPYKMLIGHSFGALTAINILLNHTDMFNSYVAIDPSMWWDGKKLLNQSRQLLAQKQQQEQWVELELQILQ
jgi:predicted alpha/beta superfamily hydrolase